MGLTVAPAARADKVVVVAEVIVSPCRSGRRLKAMTATPITAIVRAITGGGGTLAGRFIAGYLIAMRPRDKGSGAKLDVTQATEEGMCPDGRAMAFLNIFFADTVTRASWF